MTAESVESGENAEAGQDPPDRQDPRDLAAELEDLQAALPSRVDVGEEGSEAGLARLVLALLEFLREVLEHQAVRRMESGSLTEEEIERLGLALMRLAERMEEMKETFGLTDEDLRLDLGPLGKLR